MLMPASEPASGQRRQDNQVLPSLHIKQVGGATHIIVQGAWNSRSLNASALAALAAAARDAYWDLGEVSRLDHNGALLLWRAWGRKLPENIVLRPEHEALFARLDEAPASSSSSSTRVSPSALLVDLGTSVIALLDHFADLIELLGRVILDVVHLLVNPGRWPWREVSASIYRTGAQALGITALVGSLIGVVLSYLSANQLRAFGADVYIVDLLGISVIRELGPVLAAILVAGRSGSAITAQLGVMRLNEEIDALIVMGVPHTQRLVLPKVIALAIAVPLLVLWTNLMALIGGMVAAKLSLGLSVLYFINALPAAVPIANYWIGLGKGVVFGLLIALIACHYGLRIKPNTQSLGTGTTSSVVVAITMVILADALFAVLFEQLGI